MRSIFILIFTLSYLVSFSQNTTIETLKKDSLIIVKKNPQQGFHNDYILFIPKTQNTEPYSMHTGTEW